jgi:hypothetical protein
MLYYWLCAVFTLISSAVSFAFSVEASVKSKSQKEDAFINAKYALSRSLALFIISTGLFVFINQTFLITMSLIMIFVQILDGIIGIKISTFKTIGPIFTAIFHITFLILFIFMQTKQ